MVLTVHELPTVTITTPDATLCVGETAILTANGALNYLWSDGSTASTLNFNAVSNGTYPFGVVGTDIYGCSDDDQISIVVNPLPNVLFTSNMNYGGDCNEFCPTFTDLSSPASASVYWAFGNDTYSTQVGQVVGCYNSIGCFDVTLTSTTAEGCSASLTQQNYICVNEVIAAFEPDTYEQPITNPYFEFQNTSQNATSYQWTFGDPPPSSSNAINPNFTYSSYGVYTVMLVAYAQDGCSDTAYQVITVKDIVILYVPNTFTPNEDGLNELFIPQLTAGFDRDQGYEFTIYDRWGEQIFQSTQVLEGWDGTFQGKLVQNGTYLWKIRFKDSMNNRVYEEHGHVNLVR
jgi:gliding motility-associated-like protein